MTTEQLIENYTPAVDTVAVVICLLMLFVIFKVLYFSRDRKFVFMERSLIFTAIGSAANIGFYLIIKNFGCVPLAIILLRDVYHISFLLCLYCFMLYMKRMIDIKDEYERQVSYLTRIMFAGCVVLEVLSPFTGLGFSYRDGLWHDTMASFYNLFYLYAYILFLVMLMFYSSRLIRSVRVCLLAAASVDALIMAYQAILNINTYTSITYILPIMVVMILIHSKPFDDKTGSLSLRSFESYVERTVNNKVPVDYMILKMDMNTLDGMPTELGKELNSFWHAAFREATVFMLATDTLALAIPKSKANGNIQEKINGLLDSELPRIYSEFHLPYKLIGLFDVDFIESVPDMLSILRYLINKMDDNTVLIVDEKEKQELRKIRRIKSTLDDIEKKQNMDDPRVLLYLQPIRNMSTGVFDTAEALMRLDMDGEIIMPGLFIPLAEESNYIHTLSKIMLNKVCACIRNLEDEGYKFSRISVNFTASEIIAGNFCDDILEIIKSHGIDPSKIGIELTESQTERDFRIVKDKIQTLRNEGLTLYLDDIGTGYSNLDRIVQYDVDVVKFDRFFLLEAEKSAKVINMMKHLSEAFMDLDYKLLFEGVETDDHEKLCLNCGSNYIQGFKYSKPVPVEEFKKFLER